MMFGLFASTSWAEGLGDAAFFFFGTSVAVTDDNESAISAVTKMAVISFFLIVLFLETGKRALVDMENTESGKKL